MSSPAPDPEKRDPKKRDPRTALIFDDPLTARSADDTDRGWGDRPAASDNSAADLARFLDEKPPHHL